MVQFSQAPIIEEGIDSIVSEQEKKERIQRALDIHMLDNREKHIAPQGQTLFSFTQGDPNAVIGKAHGFGQAMEEEKKAKSIEQQRQEQQQQQWQSSGHKTAAAPVRTCPCCVQFLQDTFHMSDKQANEFVGGATGGPVGYGSNTASESYGAGASGEYSGNSSSGSYSSSSGAGHKPNDEESNYFGNKGGYQP